MAVSEKQKNIGGTKMSQLTIAAIIMAVTFICFFIPSISNVTVALGAAIAFGLTGIVDSGSLFSNFVSSTCILMMGMMTIGGAMFQTGLGNWIGNVLVKLTGTKKGRIQLMVLVVTAVLATSLSGTAALMVMFPLMCSIAISTGISMTNIVIYQMAGSVIGSWMTFAGCGMIGASAGILEASGYRMWSFFEIAWYGIPRAIILAVLIYFLMNRFVINGLPFKAPDEGALKTEERQADKLTPKMIITLVILVLTISGFIISPSWLPIHMCAALGALACLITGCITPKQMFYSAINWETIILIGGMSTFAKGMQASGFGQLLADSILGIVGENASPVLVIFVLMVVTCIITQFMSDNATVGITAPIAIMLATAQGIEPYAYVMACLVGCSAAHFSVMASPSMAFTVGIGGYKPSTIAKYAALIELPSSLLAGMIMIPLIWL